MPNCRLTWLILCMYMLLPTQLAAEAQTFESGHLAYREGNFSQAYLAFKTAAEQGDDRAFGRLGGMYLYGVGTKRSFAKAYLWFAAAQKMGDKYAEGFKRTAASMLDPVKIPELQTEAEELVQRLGKRIGQQP